MLTVIVFCYSIVSIASVMCTLTINLLAYLSRHSKVAVAVAYAVASHLITGVTMALMAQGQKDERSR